MPNANWPLCVSVPLWLIREDPMDHFAYRNGELYCEDVPVARIASEVGTPLYVYSRATVLHHYEALSQAFAAVDPLICYSVKANPNLAILTLLAQAGAGFDVVSGGELFRVLKAGGRPDEIVFAGVGKTDAEMEQALQAGILMFDVESEPELDALADCARRLETCARVALRVNPDVDPHTHTYIATGKRGTKFGIDLETAFRLASEWPAGDRVRLAGVHMHIGSQITEVAPYVEALTKVAKFVEHVAAAGHEIEYLNLGGGFGIFYREHEAPPAAAFAERLVPMLRRLGRKVVMEPGRFIVGNAGILLTRVTFVKTAGPTRFVIVDAGMNDLIRPTLYQAYHKIWPVRASSGPPDIAENSPQRTQRTQRTQTRAGIQNPEFEESRMAAVRILDSSNSSNSSNSFPSASSASSAVNCDVVGPICESGDFFAKDRPLPPVARGDLLSIFSAGAYGMSMASNYNARCRAAEVLVEGATWRLIRRRESYSDLIAPERA